MKIDAHQHFWRYNERDYGWMDDTMEVLKTDYTPPDLFPQLIEAGIDGTVAVQARRMLDETEYLLALAQEYDWILAVVGWVDFSSPEVEADLERFSTDSTFSGVRELIHDMPDPEYALSREHVHGVGLLAKYGLTYDLLLKPRHIEPAVRLADIYPNQPFVIDHIAKPDIAGGKIDAWRKDMVKIARRDNVRCKLSGMVTEAGRGEWTADQIKPYMDVCLELFGPQRLMIGSDWPVCTLAAEYRTVMGLVVDYVDRLTPSERAAVLGETCAEFYGL
jgi:L-fucono-1,5-lactonase